MAISSVECYSEADRIEAAHVGAEARWTPLASGQKAVELVRVQFDRLRVGRFRESGPRIRQARQVVDRVFIKFHCSPGADMIVDGTSLAADTILCHSRADEFVERTTGPVDWGILSLPIEDMITVSVAFSAGDFETPRHTLTIAPPREAMERLRELQIATGTLARHAPHVLANDHAARGLEQSLIEAMAVSLGGDAATDTWTRHSRRIVMRRFQQVLEENIEEPMYVPEICKALGVSERGLRHCCEQYLNMSPKQFLTLRRMHMAHRALRSATNANQNVTEIAMRFGFWHLGRFAVVYRSVFGESPSATLKRAK